MSTNVPPVTDEIKKAQHDANRDPLSGAAGAHPVGTGVGAAAGGITGAVTGAIAGSVAGPVGTVIGGVVGTAVGAVSGALAGNVVAENVNPTVEHGYWRENYLTTSYVRGGTPYAEYAPAYQYGWEAQFQHPGKHFDEVESSLGLQWDTFKGTSKLAWDKAKLAARDSWSRARSNMRPKTNSSNN